MGLLSGWLASSLLSIRSIPFSKSGVRTQGLSLKFQKARVPPALFVVVCYSPRSRSPNGSAAYRTTYS
uniref:Uncharacterized protein n=1 Tax=Anopheles braziliensis TaxID=58242 RepID=A0A2M3ZM23_9DIPT